MIVALVSAVVSTLGAALLGITSVTLVSAAVSTLVSGGVLALGTTTSAVVAPTVVTVALGVTVVAVRVSVLVVISVASVVSGGAAVDAELVPSDADARSEATGIAITEYGDIHNMSRRQNNPCIAMTTLFCIVKLRGINRSLNTITKQSD